MEKKEKNIRNVKEKVCNLSVRHEKEPYGT